MKLPDSKNNQLRQTSATAAIIILVLLCFLFYHAASVHKADGSTAIQEATTACLTMQNSPGDFSASPVEDNAWFFQGSSSSTTIELDEINSNHSVVSGGDLTTTVVMGRRRDSLATLDWVQELQNITSTAIYIVDDPNAKGLHLERNHGRESIVYLKYIIDHFDKLNDITFFFHPARFTWHNNMLLKEDSVTMINRMSRPQILRKGYVNSRCDAWPGCPSWVTYNPSQAEHAIDTHRQADKFNPELFSQLFPGRRDYPRYFGQPCCSQFAVSRDAIHRVGLEQFQRLYDWVDSMRSDWNSGRMMEVLWQYIFLDRGVVCPSTEQCYCDTYNVCYGNDEDMVKLIDKWNDYRARTDALSEQVVAAEKRLRDKIKFLRMMASNDPANKVVAQQPYDEEEDFRMASATDEELIKLRQDYEYVKQQSKNYKNVVMQKWGVEKSSEWW